MKRCNIVIFCAPTLNGCFALLESREKQTSFQTFLQRSKLTLDSDFWIMWSACSWGRFCQLRLPIELGVYGAWFGSILLMVLTAVWGNDSSGQENLDLVLGEEFFTGMELWLEDVHLIAGRE